MKNKVIALAQEALREVMPDKKKAKNVWTGSPNAEWEQAEIDTRGKAGEALVVKLLQAAGRAVIYKGDATHEEKHWDFRCDDLSYEVKTERIGTSSDTFQHENIFKTRQYDGLIFVDIAPHEIYISCWAKSAIPWKRLHHRKDGAYFKWDTGLTSERSLAQGKRREFCVRDKRVCSVADFMAQFEAMEKTIRQNTLSPDTL